METTNNNTDGVSDGDKKIIKDYTDAVYDIANEMQLLAGCFACNKLNEFEKGDILYKLLNDMDKQITTVKALHLSFNLIKNKYAKYYITKDTTLLEKSRQTCGYILVLQDEISKYKKKFPSSEMEDVD